MILNPLPFARSILFDLSSAVWLLWRTAQEMGDQIARGRLPFRPSLFPTIRRVSWHPDISSNPMDKKVLCPR